VARLLVIDEQINSKLAIELGRRGKNALSVQALFEKGLRNPDLLERLGQEYPNCVFITEDDTLPIDHPQSVGHTTVAIAIIDPEAPAGYDLEQWDAEMVHRWAHRIEEQAIGTVRRYSGNGNSKWHVRKRARTALVERLQRQLRS
jgi:hypothetical protein